jgi:hypothetical protein
MQNGSVQAEVFGILKAAAPEQNCCSGAPLLNRTLFRSRGTAQKTLKTQVFRSAAPEQELFRSCSGAVQESVLTAAQIGTSKSQVLLDAADPEPASGPKE